MMQGSIIINNNLQRFSPLLSQRMIPPRPLPLPTTMTLLVSLPLTHFTAQLSTRTTLSLSLTPPLIHLSLMEDLLKANAILLPLESVLSKDVAAMTDAIARERDTKKEISHIHGQAIYQSYCLRIREACQTFKPLVPSLTLAVKGLCSKLIRLARTASLHAGNLHKALEGIGESQEAKSQNIALSRSDPASEDAAEFDDEEGESLSKSDGGGNADVIGFSQLSLEDKGWVSPPDSIYCSSSGSGIRSTEASFPDSLNDLTEIKELHSQSSNSRNPTDHIHSAPISHADGEEISSSNANEEISNSASISHTDGSAVPFDKSVTILTNALNTLNESVQKSEGEAEPVSSKIRN